MNAPTSLSDGSRRLTTARIRLILASMTRFGSRLLGGVGLVSIALTFAGCAFGPKALARNQLDYNEVIKTTTEEQLLLNIVRLRYTDTANSLAVSTIAAQYELTRNFQLTPFFVASGAEIAKTWAAVLPQLA